MSGDNATGPVDYLVLEFPEQDDPTGDAATELRALIESGVIRLFDIVAVHKSADGEHRVVDLGQFSKQDDDGFAFFAGMLRHFDPTVGTPCQYIVGFRKISRPVK